MKPLQLSPIYATMTKVAGVQAIASAATVVQDFDTIETSKGSISPGLANNEIVIDVTGFYLVHLHQYYDAEDTIQADTRRLMILEWSNQGAAYADLRTPHYVPGINDTSSTVLSACYVFQFQKGDKIRATAHQGSDESVDLLASPIYNRLTAVLMPMKAY